MERIVGINEVRPRLTKLLDELAEGGEAIVITAKSQPRGVLLSYAEYRELKTLAGKVKGQWLEETIGRFQERGEAAGLTERDVQKEIEAVRRARRR